VCGHFGFFDARGRSQSAGFGKALRELERAGNFVLPAASYVRSGDRAGPRRLDAAVEAPQEVPGQAEAVQGLTLIKVENVDQMRMWNQMMLRGHLFADALHRAEVMGVRDQVIEESLQRRAANRQQFDRAQDVERGFQ
jgi:hypothetical protein